MEELEKIRNLTRGVTMLYVEDDATLRTQVTTLLKRLGIEVDAVADGKEGLKKAQAKRYDLLLTDITMPGINGLEVIRQVKTWYPDQTAIVISAYNDEANLREYERLGVAYYCDKPVVIPHFIGRLMQLLKELNQGPLRD